MPKFGLRYHFCSDSKAKVVYFDTEEKRDKEFARIYGNMKKKRFHFLIKV